MLRDVGELGWVGMMSVAVSLPFLYISLSSNLSIVHVIAILSSLERCLGPLVNVESLYSICLIQSMTSCNARFMFSM